MCLLLKHNITRITAILMAAMLIGSRSYGEEAGAEPFSFSHEDVAPNLVVISCRIEGKKKQGNGVIVRMEGKPYLLTNLHTVLGAEQIDFTTADGRRLTPRQVELSNGRDLVRLAVEEDGFGLPVSAQTSMNMPIAIFSAGEGDKEHTRQGTIIGVGSSKIEVSARFDDSSNGAPAINQEKEVVGIAAYSREFRQHAMKKGTRFEKDSRYFCIRMGRNDWKPVNWRNFNNRYGKAYRKHESFCNRIIGIFNEGENYNASSKEATQLAALCRTHALELQLLCDRSDVNDFLLNDFEERMELLEYAASQLESYANIKR